MPGRTMDHIIDHIAPSAPVLFMEDATLKVPIGAANVSLYFLCHNSVYRVSALSLNNPNYSSSQIFVQPLAFVSCIHSLLISRAA